MQPHPYQNLHQYPLTSSKNIWPKISVAYFTKWFQSIFTVGGWRMYPFNFPLLALYTYPQRVAKGPYFEAWTRSEPEVTSSTFIFEARFRHESQINRGSWDMRNCGVTNNAVCRCCSRYTVYHTENSNHLDQNIGIICPKRSMLVNDNTAGYNVEKKKKNYHEIIYDGAIGIKETF